MHSGPPNTVQENTLHSSTEEAVGPPPDKRNHMVCLQQLRAQVRAPGLGAQECNPLPGQPSRSPERAFRRSGTRPPTLGLHLLMCPSARTCCSTSHSIDWFPSTSPSSALAPGSGKDKQPQWPLLAASPQSRALLKTAPSSSGQGCLTCRQTCHRPTSCAQRQLQRGDEFTAPQ